MLFKTSYILHPALLQYTLKFKKKKRKWFELFKWHLETQALSLRTLLLCEQGKEPIIQLSGKTWLSNNWLSNILLADSSYIPPEGYRTPIMLKKKKYKVPNPSKVNDIIMLFPICRECSFQQIWRKVKKFSRDFYHLATGKNIFSE